MTTAATTRPDIKPVTSANGQHSVLKFSSFSQLIAYNELGTDYRSDEMRGNSKFAGAKSMPEAYAKAKAGLPRDGIEALSLAEKQVQERDRDLVKPNFQPYNDVTGVDVDVALYLTGEPECMINYQLEDEPRTERVVTLVASLSYHCGISEEAIKTQGQALMALMEAIESTGRQTEIWADLVLAESLSNPFGNPDPRGKTGRVAVRLKAPGELFDAGMFMYALTHNSMLRSILFNTMHGLPSNFKQALSVPGYYGYPISKDVHMEDYPEGAIYIPSIREDNQAGKVVQEKLQELDLLRN